MKFLMHQKVILVFVVLIFGAFLAVKFSFWFIVIPSVFSIFIFIVAKDKNVLKFIVPIAAILIGGASVFGYFGTPSVKDLNNKLQVYETELSKMTNELSEKQKVIASAKEDQGWIRSTFNDIEKVDYLEQERKSLEDEISNLQDDIYAIKKKIRKRS